MGKKPFRGTIENKVFMNQKFGGNETGHETNAGGRNKGTKRRVIVPMTRNSSPDAGRWEISKVPPRRGIFRESYITKNGSDLEFAGQ